MNRLSFSLGSVCIMAAFVVALAPGCTTHGEGGRCDPQNLNASGGFADCEADLVCTPGAYLSLPEGGAVQGNICCPKDRSTSTTDICKGSPVSPGSDASIPETSTEASTDATSDQSTSDVVTDVVTDSPSDSATDASGDAPTD